MSPDPLPEPWRSALEPKGVRSKRGLATKAGIAPQTAKRLIDGEGSPSPETVAAVADALFAGDRNRVWELAGQTRQDFGDWQLPPEASQLNQEQRAAVLAVVRAMLPQESGRGDGNVDRDAAPTIPVIPSAGVDLAKRTGELAPVIRLDTFWDRLNTESTRLSLQPDEVREAVQNTVDALAGDSLHEDVAARRSTD